MPVSKAQALLAGLMIQDAEPAADEAALERLALWLLQRYAPIVAADPPAGIVIDSTGADHLHCGEQAMLAGMVERLNAAGIEARAAIADCRGAAHALVRHSTRPVLVNPARSRAAILQLPVAALRLPSEMVASLRLLGFELIGELLAEPRAPLSLHVGPELGRWLDQAMGRTVDPIEPIRAPEVIEVWRSFAEPIAAAETIARYLGKLTIQLCTLLDARGLEIRQLDLIRHRVDDRAQAVRIGTATPARDVKRLNRLLCERIETMDPGFGIELLALAAVRTQPTIQRQLASSLVA